MELHLGKMANKELVEWFNCSDKHFRNVHKKKMEELKNYAEFEVGRGYVNITKIIIATYDPKMTSNKVKILNMVDRVWDKDGLDTCLNVARKIKKELNSPLAETTISNYVLEARNTLYGKPRVCCEAPVIRRGKIGSCEYVWCKKQNINKDNICKYALLSEKEQKIKKKLLNKYYGSEKANQEARSLTDNMLANGEITKEQYADTLNDLIGAPENRHKLFLDELRAEIGGIIVRGTLVERDKEGWFFIEDGTDTEVPIS